MNIVSINIRGGGSLVKRRRIYNLIKSGKVDFVLIQETKCDSVDDKFVSSFWSQEEISCSCSFSSGKSGGLFSIWKSSETCYVFSFSGVGFLDVTVVCKGIFYNILNIYSMCNILLKITLWKDIMSLIKKYVDEEWIISGDFNAISKLSEKKGSPNFNKQGEIREFRDFLGSSRLVDVPCLVTSLRCLVRMVGP